MIQILNFPFAVMKNKTGWPNVPLRLSQITFFTLFFLDLENYCY